MPAFNNANAMSSMKSAARAVLVICVACCALSAASAAAEPATGAVVGRRKMLAVRDLLQSKPIISVTPCAQHTQATKQQIAKGSSAQTTQPKLATKTTAVVTGSNPRQLMQVPPVAPAQKPVTPPPAQRRGFATGRSGAPNPKQQRRPVTPTSG